MPINFMRWRKAALAGSLLAIGVLVAVMAVRGLNVGIDFTGGVVVEVHYDEPVDLAPVRASLSNDFADVEVTHFGNSNTVQVRTMGAGNDATASTTGSSAARNAAQNAAQNAEISDAIAAAIYKAEGFEIRRVEFVGPQIGEELTRDGLLAVLYALLGILVYIGLRFQWQFALGAVAALFHDVLIVVGLFALFGWSFDLTVLAALLAVIGYSLNDTIVVFDRVRENFVAKPENDPLDESNRALNDMLARTLTTSLTTLLVLFSLAILGGETIRYFAVALILGIVVGTYSSIYIATNMALLFGLKPASLVPPKKEGVVEEKDAFEQYVAYRQALEAEAANMEADDAPTRPGAVPHPLATKSMKATKATKNTRKSKRR